MNLEPARKTNAASELRRARFARKAEMASGIGKPDGEDHQAQDRGADGRRLPDGSPMVPTMEPSINHHETITSKDAAGETGNLLDISG